MALLPTAFDATEHDTTQRTGFDSLPCGIVRMEVEASEIKETDRGGAGMKYTSTILAPEEVKGRKLFGYFYLREPDGTEGFGAKDFASLIRATAIDPKITDTEEVHFFPYMARLGWSPVKYVRVNKAFKLDAEGNKFIKDDARVEVQEYYFPKDDNGNDIDLPEAVLDDPQPRQPMPEAGAIPREYSGGAAPANDNRAAANTNTATKPAATGEKKKNPWDKKTA